MTRIAWPEDQRNDFVRRLLDLMAANLAGEIEYYADYSSHLCESPIESMFYLTWIGMGRIESRAYPELAELKMQCAIRANGRDYRVDGAIPLGMIAVELDGHEFHERTPEQVAYRNQRDRDLQLAGWVVLHFSGREVFQDPWKCANQLFRATVDRGCYGRRGAGEPGATNA